MVNNNFCSICGNGITGKAKLRDGIRICKTCVSRALINNGSISMMNMQDFINHLEYRNINWKLLKSFEATHVLATSRNQSYMLHADANKGIWYHAMRGDVSNIPIYRFSEIITYELVEDGYSIAKGGTGRAIAGGLLFGGVGAIVGGVTGKRKTKTTVNSMKLMVSINNKYSNHLEIDFLYRTGEIKTGSGQYKVVKNLATSVVSLFDFMSANGKQAIAQQSITQQAPQRVDVADLIFKLKTLLDAGAITQQEYDEKKKELLAKYII